MSIPVNGSSLEAVLAERVARSELTLFTVGEELVALGELVLGVVDRDAPVSWTDPTWLQLVSYVELEFFWQVPLARAEPGTSSAPDATTTAANFFMILEKPFS